MLQAYNAVMRRWPLWLACLAGVLLLVAAPRVSRRLAMERALFDRQRIAEIISLQERASPMPSVPLPAPPASSLPDSPAAMARKTNGGVDLPIPFTSQAPLEEWDPLHQEACEEAAVLMVIEYLSSGRISGAPLSFAAGQPGDRENALLLDPTEAEAALQELVRINAEVLAYPVDQTAEQIVELIQEIAPELTARVIVNPTIADLKGELRAGHPIIVPAAGRRLGNPFYRRPGPLYHALVLRGYVHGQGEDLFIVNDPGTKRGEGYVYRPETILEAMHEWPFAPGEKELLGEEERERRMEEGGKVVIVVSRR